MTTAVRLAGEQRQVQTLAPHQLQGLKLLAKSLPELRAEIVAEISRNPALDDRIDHPLETSLDAALGNREVDADSPEYAEGDADGSRGGEEGADGSDWPEDDYEPVHNYDEEAAERRARFFDNQVKTETLQEHLIAQLPLSDIPPGDWPLAETLIGDLDAKGYYKGSIADAQMSFGKTEAEVRGVLAQITLLDPPGCGATDVRECLLAQMDALDDSPYEDEVRAMIDRHLADIAAGREAQIMKSLGLTRGEYAEAVKALRTLDPRPGQQYPSERDRVEYVNPEIHAVRDGNGRWIAVTDERSLPKIRIAKPFAAILKDPLETKETKAYVRERIAAANAFRDAVVRRQETVVAIAQEIFDRQQGFFEHGFKALKPLTELEVAKAVGVHGTTVSRTVRDKYAATPQGTIELRRFFVTGVKIQGGETVSQEAVLAKLQEIVDGEAAAAPLSDEKISALLKAAGYPVARRTVAKYRDIMGIPGAAMRAATAGRGTKR